MKKLSMISVVMLAMALLAGCDKDTNPIDSTPTKKPTAPQVSMTGPNTNSTDPYAQQAQSFSMMFNGYTQFFTAFASLEGEQNGNTWTYTYNFGTMSETITVTQQTDGSYTWTVVFNGVDGNTTYTNWKAMEGTSSADNKSGSWKIYAENSTQLEAELAWNTDAQGNETGMLKAYTNGVLNEQLDIVNNIDGSGSMKMYQKKNNSNDLFLNIEITWIANGTGAYTVYDENGVVLESGTF
jgi:hypothetical protein